MSLNRLLERLCLPHLLSIVLLLYLNVTWSLQDSPYTQEPGNITSATGDEVTFNCGILASKGNVTFTIQGRYNKTLHCPGNNSHLEWTIESLKWSCSVTEDEVLAVWTITGTSLSDNGTKFRCKEPGQPEAVGYLWVHVSSNYFGILIGCVIGGFFGILIVFGLTYVFLQRSETFRECFRGKSEDDECTIMEESKGN